MVVHGFPKFNGILEALVRGVEIHLFPLLLPILTSTAICEVSGGESC